MTALARVPAAPTRPIPWPRLAWVVWRRYRSTVAGTVAVLAVVGTYLLVDGERMRAAYAAFRACAPTNSAACEFAWQDFRDGFGQPGLVGVIVMLLPGIVGAFAGAPVLAREFETGTFRYAWTQGAGRMRWAVALVAPGAVGVAIVLGVFGLLVGWHNQPLVDSGVMPRLHATVFPATGLAAAGWAMAGFALGVLAGLLWRRTLPALASAGAVWFGLAFVGGGFLRLHYLAPLTTTSLQLSSTDMPVAQWWTKGGLRVGDAQINSTLRAIGVNLNGSGNETVHPGSSDVDPVQYLIQHGFQQVTSYQPVGRYWTFQWIEFGWLTVLTVVLLGATLWLLRRRPA